jgi:hypothetical protein
MSPMTARSVVVATPVEGAREVRDLHHAAEGVDDPPVDQEVDVDRRVVAGDRRLRRHLDELLAQVDRDGSVDDRIEEHQARALDEMGPGAPEPEDNEPRVFVDDTDREVDEDEQEQDDDADDDR